MMTNLEWIQLYEFGKWVFSDERLELPTYDDCPHSADNCSTSRAIVSGPAHPSIFKSSSV